MGGALNAVALGRIGLSVACSDEKLTVLLRMRRYLRYLGNLGKNTLNTDNLVVVTTGQLEDALGVQRGGV